MDIIPAIDIRGGRCVRLVQGDYARETVFSDDPVAMARHWAAQGATRLHVVDLDAAREGRPVNDAVVVGIIRALPQVNVQVAGGMRDADTVTRWIDAGAARVVLGTVAVEDRDAVRRVFDAHGATRLAVGIDARDGKAATRGWMESSGIAAGDLAHDMIAFGLRHFIYTDISRDGMMEHIDLAALDQLVKGLRAAAEGVSLVYSGGVTSIEDITALASRELEGSIVGKALYEGTMSLAHAREAAAQKT